MIDLSKIEKLPAHVGIIMDGNGRWAKKRFLPRSMGHKAGASAVRKAVEFAARVGLKCLTLYAFSTENWRRPADEVNALMELLVKFLKKELPNLQKQNICLRIIGQLDRFPAELQQQLSSATLATKENTGMVLCVALGYSGQEEILAAVNRLIKKGVTKITGQDLEANLFTAGLPELDLLIRTSGEQRISNFLLWQSAYSEFWFTEVLWPDFDEKVFAEALLEFGKRERRYGDV